MKHFSFLLSLAVGLFVSAFAFQSCQKESLQVANPSNPNVVAGERAPIVYGVTEYKPGNPSRLISMDLGTGNIQNILAVKIPTINGPVALDDLKGVCLYGDQVWLTTGPHAQGLYSNLLVKVNTANGDATVISQSTIGTVSDIDYDPINNVVYGLANNNNALVKIQDLGNNWGTYTKIGNITNLGNNYVAKGLSMARDAGGTRIILAATQALAGDALVYSVPATAGAATTLSTITPALELGHGHCGIGFQMGINSMLINRSGAVSFGLNAFAWANPLAANTASAFWGGFGSNFEDLTSTLQ
jgi:hypothetical protein